MQRVWYRKHDGCWYATINDRGRQKQVKLHKGSNTRETRAKAEEVLIQELARLPKHVAARVPTWLTVGHVITGFLVYSVKEHEPETHQWYKALLTDFSQRCGRLRIAELRKKHVLDYVKGRAYNPTSQNKAIGAIKRAFNWAVEEEHIAANPIAYVRKPKACVRDRVLDQTERELIVKSIRDRAFADYFAALSLTGCRPGEVAKVTAAEVNLDLGLWVLPQHKTAKRTGKPRIVYLSPPALELTKQLCRERPTGPLFLNRCGKKWTRNAIRCRFRRLRERHPELAGVVAYTVRSTFATDALEAGVPDASVAALLGHTNTDTLHKFYARLSRRVNHLRDAAAKAHRKDVVS